MYKVKRAKRDTAENIYRHCKAAGTCPPDVENKIEGNTLADRLLRIFSSIIYLGGLGIGTGKGTGGSLGYRPIETPNIPTRVTPRPTRPSTFGVPIDPISSADVVTPAGPSIVPLNEGGIPDPTVISTGAGPGEGLGEVEILTNIDATQDISTVGGHPTVIPTTENEIAVLDITPIEPPPVRIAYENPESTNLTYITSTLPTDSNINVFVHPDFNGVTVGEEIELQPISTIEEFQIEENIPKTSTPVRVLESAVGRARQLYHRFTQQVQTRNADFLGQPSRLVQFEFVNPAFEEDITLEFEKDLADVAAAPDEAFSDVIKLQRPIFSETEEGLVRVSRLGTKASMKTRSGMILKQPVHYYFDISEIPPISENIELSTLGENTGDVTIVDELERGIDVSPRYLFSSTYNESDLLDTDVDVFSSAHVVLQIEEENEVLNIPTLPPGISIKVFVDDYAKDIFVSYPDTNTSVDTSTIITPTVQPDIIIDPFSSDYYLHPSLLKRRKRKRSDMF